MPTIKQGQINLTEEFAVMKNEINHIKTDITEIKTLLKEHIQWEDNKYSELKNDFASKWVEKVSIGLIIAAVSALVTALINVL
jgi:hypothetical protein